MRIVVFYVSLCLLLLCGSETLFAGTHHGCASGTHKSGHVKRHHAKLNPNRPDNNLLDEKDLDLDEDYLRRHEADGQDLSRFPAERYSLQNWLYFTFCPQLILAHYHTTYSTIPPFCGDPSPIYITQRVLKI